MNIIQASSAYGRSSSYDDYGFFEDYSENAYGYPDYGYDSDLNDDFGGIDDLSDPSDIEFVGDDEDIERFIQLPGCRVRLVSPIGSKIDFWGILFFNQRRDFRYYPEIHFYIHF